VQYHSDIAVNITVILRSLQRCTVKQSIQTVSWASQDTHCTVVTGSVGEEVGSQCMYDLIYSRQSGPAQWMIESTSYIGSGSAICL